MGNNRYAGISPFTSEQSNIFFGRDKDIEELYKKIVLEKQVLLYAKSGIGKSSLVNAGVCPKLNKEESYKTINIRFRAYNKKDLSKTAAGVATDFITPVKRIVNELKNLDGISINELGLLEQIEADENRTLWFYFKKIQLLRPDLKMILIFDQFEELFSYPKELINEFKIQLSEILNPEVPEAFVELFAIARKRNKERMNRNAMSFLNENLDIKAMYVIRSDRLSDLNFLHDRIPDIQKSFYELKPLTTKQATDAIVNPAQRKGKFASPVFVYSNEALDKILNFLTRNIDQKIETTQLQIVCQRIENKVPKIKKRHTVTVNDIPDFKNIFFEFYHNSIAYISANYQDNARLLVENELIKNRQRISLDGNICKEYIPREELQKLVNNHLLRAERNTVGGFSYELSHDTLIEPIYEAAEERRLKEEELKLEKERLLELNRLKEKQKRDRRKFALLFIGFLIAVVLSGFAFVQMNRANKALEEVERKNKKIDSTLVIVEKEKEKNAELFKEANRRKREALKLKSKADTARIKAENSELLTKSLLDKSKKLLGAFLPNNQDNFYNYFIKIADSLFNIGNYNEALKNYNLAQTSPEISKKSYVKQQITKTEKLIGLWENALSWFRKKSYEQSFNVFKQILSINIKDISAEKYYDVCYLLTMQRFIEVYNREVAGFIFLSPYEITNNQYAVFLNEYGSDTVKYGKHRGKTLIKEHEWGLYKKDGVWVSNTGFENNPAICVSWYGANEFCKYFNFELPPASIINEFDHKYYDYERKEKTTSKVKNLVIYNENFIEYKISSDFFGNVWKWCSDKIDNTNENLIIGGSFYTNTYDTNIYDDIYLISVIDGSSLNPTIGFRVVKIVMQ